jgi:hypothetical protein
LPGSRPDNDLAQQTSHNSHIEAISEFFRPTNQRSVDSILADIKVAIEHRPPEPPLRAAHYRQTRDLRRYAT